MGHHLSGALAYAHDFNLLSPSRSGLKNWIVQHFVIHLFVMFNIYICYFNMLVVV